jgi:phosphoglycerate dehydrogenase-like enzyme
VSNRIDRLRVVVATPLSEELCECIVAAEHRIDLVRDQALLKPMRHPGDHAGDPAFIRTPEQQSTFDALVDTAEALYGIPDESPDALRRTVTANPGLRWVQTMAAGGGSQVKAAGLTAAELDRIAFSTSAGVHAAPLAEYAVFGLMAGAKDLPRLLDQQSRQEWSGRWAMRQLSEQTVLVIGLGSIGREVARKVSALGARVIGVNRSTGPVDCVDRILPTTELANAVSQADSVVVTLPGTDATLQLISADVLAHFRPGTTVVSIGRGTVIDEFALIEALQDGRVGFAALDVFAAEPLAPDSVLWKLPNVLVSPHTAALNPAEDRLIADLFIDNARRLLDGEPLINSVNTVEFY